MRRLLLPVIAFAWLVACIEPEAPSRKPSFGVSYEPSKHLERRLAPPTGQKVSPVLELQSLSLDTRASKIRKPFRSARSDPEDNKHVVVVQMNEMEHRSLSMMTHENSTMSGSSEFFMILCLAVLAACFIGFVISMDYDSDENENEKPAAKSLKDEPQPQPQPYPQKYSRQQPRNDQQPYASRPQQQDQQSFSVGADRYAQAPLQPQEQPQPQPMPPSHMQKHQQQAQQVPEVLQGVAESLAQQQRQQQALAALAEAAAADEMLLQQQPRESFRTRDIGNADLPMKMDADSRWTRQSSEEDSPRFALQTTPRFDQQADSYDGSWAKAYREATGERKEALELLERCNIISSQEFAYSRVSQEHIDECVWIGSHMLRQKPLEEWVALWHEAQQTFKDNVTACFTARTDARTSYGSMAVRSDVPQLDCLSLGERGQAVGEEDVDDPYTTRSAFNYSHLSPTGRTSYSSYRHRGEEGRDSLASNGLAGIPDSMERITDTEESIDVDQGIDQGLGASSPQAPAAVSPAPGSPRSPAQRDLSPLILRCREIMAAPPQEGVPAPRSPLPQRISSNATTVIGGDQLASAQNGVARQSSSVSTDLNLPPMPSTSPQELPFASLQNRPPPTIEPTTMPPLRAPVGGGAAMAATMPPQRSSQDTPLRTQPSGTSPVFPGPPLSSSTSGELPSTSIAMGVVSAEAPKESGKMSLRSKIEASRAGSSVDPYSTEMAAGPKATSFPQLQPQALPSDEGSRELLVASAPITPQGGVPAPPTISPLLQTREDRISENSSAPQFASGPPAPGRPVYQPQLSG